MTAPATPSSASAASATTWYASPHASFSKDAFISALKEAHGGDALDADVAAQLDAQDPLAKLRDEYCLPSMQDIGVAPAPASSSSSSSPSPAASTADPTPRSSSEPALYLCGNSLGPLPKRSRALLQQEIDTWATRGVLGHFDHPHGRPWAKQEESTRKLVADIVGAKPSETAVMGTLTQNIHNVLSTFYRPRTHPAGVQALLKGNSNSAPAGTANGSTNTSASGGSSNNGSASGKVRHKIVYEKKAFPSDVYALDSVVRLAGYDPARSLVALAPRGAAGAGTADGQGEAEAEPEATLRTEDILAAIRALGEEGETAVIMLAGIQYYTGQWFEMKRITEEARKYDIIVGWDLAHAFANVPLALHDWGVDFAVWCTYKYGSSGPGGIAGLFVHERWHALAYEQLPRPAGWYGHERATRFAMPPTFRPEHGAPGWIVSNPSALDMIALHGSMETLAKAPALVGGGKAAATAQAEDDASTVGEGLVMPHLRNRSLRLTAYLEHLLLSERFLPKSLGVHIVTPADPHHRGSQLCIRIRDPVPQHGAGNAGANASANGSAREHEHAPSQANGAGGASGASGDVPPPISQKSLIARAHKKAEKHYGLVADIRNPDMLRLAPLAQYSSFTDVWRAANAISCAIKEELDALQ